MNDLKTGLLQIAHLMEIGLFDIGANHDESLYSQATEGLPDRLSSGQSRTPGGVVDLFNQASFTGQSFFH